MANYAKYTKGAMGHMLKHYERAKDKNGEYLKFGNQDIDKNRTHLNYNLAPEHNQLDFVHQRLSEVYCMNRKDVNVICSWVVTAPQDLAPEQEEDFFKTAYSFLESKYGRQNVVSAYVHKDEKTPHMHFCFMPVVADQKRGEKISAKECVKKIDLERFHEELQSCLDTKGIRCSVLNDATIEGNKAIKELKRGTARKELQQVKKSTAELKAARTALSKEVKALQQLKSIQGKVLSSQEIQDIKTESVLFDDSKVKIDKSDFDNLKKSAYGAEKTTKIYDASKAVLQKAAAMTEALEKSRRETTPEKMERLQLRKKVEDYDKALERCAPGTKKDFRNNLKAVTEPPKQQRHKNTHERGNL